MCYLVDTEEIIHAKLFPNKVDKVCDVDNEFLL